MTILFLYSQVGFHHRLDRNQCDLYGKIKRLNKRTSWEFQS